MKKIQLFFFFVFISAFCKSQLWCPVGAEWHYGYYNIGYSTSGYIRMNYAGDSIISSVTYKKIIYQAYGTQHGFAFNYPYNIILLNENNKLVTLYNGLTPQDTLFNFNANIGDTWLRTRTVYPTCNYTRRPVTVLDTGHVTINGVVLKSLLLKYEIIGYSGGTPYYYNDVAYEKIGSLGQFLDPWSCETQDLEIDVSGNRINADFRCYSDDAFTLYQKPGSLNCNAVVSVNENNGIDSYIKLYPNPAMDYITVQLKTTTGYDTGYDFTVFDFFGKEVLRSTIQQEELKFDITDLSQGIYLAVVRYGGTVKYQKKFMVQAKP